MEINDKKKIILKKRGLVVAKKSPKTALVVVDIFKTHSKYKKKFRFTKKYQAHDESGTAKVGDKVEIMAVRPVSKKKRFRIA